MTAQQKLGALQHAINRAEMGLTKVVPCPYCGVELDFTPPSVLADDWQPPTCCAEFALAAIAIMQRKEMNEAKDLIDRIHDKVGGQAVFN